MEAKLVKVENKWMNVREYKKGDTYTRETDIISHKGMIPVAIEHYDNGSRKIIVCERGHAQNFKDELDRSDSTLRKRLSKALYKDG